MGFLRTFIPALVATAILDGLWLGVIAKGLYRGMLGNMMRPSPIWPSAAVVYLLIPLGITLFAVPKAGGDPVKALLWGGLFGLVTYGIYEFTNHALLKDWPWPIVLIDAAWGIFICAAATLVASLISR